MKKLVTIILAVAFASSLCVAPAFAETYKLPADDKISYGPLTDENTTTDTTIGVTGYVGEDAIIDPDPDVPPTTYDINVAVPTAIIWAAFESDGGKVVAPNYFVENRSANSKVKVSLVSFKAVNPAGEANSAVDGVLTLNLVSKTVGAVGVNNIFVNGTGFSGTPVVLGTFDPRTTIENTGAFKFTIDGKYDGGFEKNLQPKYEMVLQFDHVEVTP